MRTEFHFFFFKYDLTLVLRSYSGNINLSKGSGGNRTNIIIGSSVGAGLLLIAAIVSCICLHKGKKKSNEQGTVTAL